MSKVFWHGDAGCHSGFARVTHAIGERLVRDYGHELHVMAINHRGDDFPSSLNPAQKTPLWLHRPDMLLTTDMYGKSRILEILGKHEPDVVVMLNDPAVLLNLLFKNEFDKEQVLLRFRPIVTYVPCDGHNLPPAWPDVLTKVSNVVAMSAFGQAAYPGSKLVYHGVDTDQFWPVEEQPIVLSSGSVVRTKRECKAAFGFDPEGTLVLRIDKNSGRKDFPATIKALIPVMKRNLEVQAHFHTDMRPSTSGGDLHVMLSRYTRDVARERFFSPDLHNSFIGWPQEDMVALYNAADIFLTTSRGEGFGLTIAEAMACGVPVIAQNVSAIPEVVGPGGILLEPQREITVPPGHDMWLADINAFTEAIEELVQSPEKRMELGQAGLNHVRTSFSWDHAARKFHEYIEALASMEVLTHGDDAAAAAGPDRPGDLHQLLN